MFINLKKNTFSQNKSYFRPIGLNLLLCLKEIRFLFHLKKNYGLKIPFGGAGRAPGTTKMTAEILPMGNQITHDTYHRGKPKNYVGEMDPGDASHQICLKRLIKI